MKNIIWTVIISAGAAALAGCASHSKPSTTTSATPAAGAMAGTNLLSSETARISYAVGMMYARNFQAQGIEVDPDLLARGLKDSAPGATTLLTQTQAHEILNEYQKTLAAKQQKLREAAAIKNKAEGEAFLATNKTNPGIITLPDGLQYLVITNGSGNLPQSNDVVTVNYRGTLLDGTEFDSSTSRGKPAQMPLDHVFPGWQEALRHMNVGSKWKVFIPPALAYGESGRPPRIMPNSVVVLELELLASEPPKPPEPLTSDIVKVPSLEEMKKGAKIEVIKPEDVEKTQAAQTNQPAK